jgi:hypothetical protein
MTKFLCMELMYEYVSGTLDPAREKDIEAYLPTDREAQRELERVKRALAYTQKAASAHVTPALHEALLMFEPQWQKSLREWTLWSSQRGWKMLPYIFVVLTTAVGLWVTKPWQGADITEVTLAEQQRAESDMPAAPPANLAVPAVAPEAAAPAPEGTPPLNTVPAPATTPATLPKIATPAPKLPGSSMPTPMKPDAEEAAVTNAGAAIAEAAAPEDESADVPPIAKGEVFRGEMSVTDFENTWPAIRDKVFSLGGKSNGAMGGVKKDGHSHFHFSIPESNLADLEQFLGTFGPVRFEREKVSRVMPRGQIRIILTVKALKDTDTTDEGSSETP